MGGQALACEHGTHFSPRGVIGIVPSRHGVRIPLRRHWSGRRGVFAMQSSPRMPSLGAVVSTASRALAAVLCCAAITVAALPAMLSWQKGLNATVWVANHTIPGKLRVRKATLGWTKPVDLEGICLEDGDGERVLDIQNITTKASLFSIVTGRSGFGDCTVSSLWMNLLEDPETGISRLARAVESSTRKAHQQPKKKNAVVSTGVVKLASDFKAVNGGLTIRGGELLLPADAAAALGEKIFVDVLVGSPAKERSEALKSGGGLRSLPVQINAWSDCLEAQVLGFLNASNQKIELIEPIKIEMDLTPELGRLYLARVNPLLGYIVGPAVAENDMPDVIMEVIPKEMKFPADEYKLRFEPMSVVLARGPILDGIFTLLSRSKNKDEVSGGRRQLKMETSAIEAVANVDGHLKCRRIDLLIAGKVHVATWGEFNWIEEKMNTKLVIPQTILKDFLGLNNLPKNFHFQVPVRGTFDRPQIDLGAAVFRIAQLTLHQQAGPFAKSLVGSFDDSTPDHDVPEPIDVLPWQAHKSGA
ncbi:uncharacterized protein LOC112351097 [Selaginella moellendorffii]|uniref:uncharacterized protein LOC112351097 n=1 Tax=Selaginella moellendorffii TaxID=88036 RepID=UPI000D1CAD90|nr:uncharacterized protein LOC112351097 [Selaginella moellendorffii]|eukprot:XP_024544112.1 uncharacterized protein LOC112351097 [Selaginella moellendorffii]